MASISHDAEQDRHSVAPTPLNVPVGQGEQDGEPSVLVNLPAGLNYQD